MAGEDGETHFVHVDMGGRTKPADYGLAEELKCARRGLECRPTQSQENRRLPEGSSQSGRYRAMHGPHSACRVLTQPHAFAGQKLKSRHIGNELIELRESGLVYTAPIVIEQPSPFEKVAGQTCRSIPHSIHGRRRLASVFVNDGLVRIEQRFRDRMYSPG